MNLGITSGASSNGKSYRRAGLNYNHDNVKQSQVMVGDVRRENAVERGTSWEAKIPSVGRILNFRKDDLDLLFEEIEQKKKNLTEITKKLRSVS